MIQCIINAFTGGADESHDCAVCGTRVEHPSLSRPLTKSNYSLYDMAESQLTADMRVCNSCRCKSIHKRYMQLVSLLLWLLLMLYSVI